VSTPILLPRLKRLGRRTRLAIALATVGGLIAIVATARATQVESPATASKAVVEEPDPVPVDPAWTIAGEPMQRTGYRNGRRHSISVVPLGPSEVEVEISTAQAFLAMRAAAADAGIELGLASGFRTAEEQRVLYRAWKKGRGNKAARPGLSNHQSGRAVDISFSRSSGAYEWLEANAMTFGFKRTVRGEPWHWEYVEAPIARGAFKRKIGKRGKAIAQAKRPARRPSTGTKSSRVASPRVASSRR
jgi:hypothetical protein